ncbi:uncharacterized protein CXQ87_000726 [Candidozyma duobushaemuli]|uniref:Topoisomerase 1-associated factor 1 n=2 Tax=Candidozyma TaxID=3303203 RepID=A0ABX8I1X1_9ASCO|nr:uncharacterized protein CXQ87_000726 [[Candida] duobushaemulonis]PVH17828.1 hypothetical protein CXQ87_000726 [[Candida] duobushaemulonis]QWU86424.1 hypothetical protein CA3LBN_000642 [[Candida] haemuloni]
MDDYRDDDELNDFIVSEDENKPDETQKENEEPESPKVDRIADLTSSLKVHESYTSKVLRAHISVLTSALGGPDHSTEEGLYKLGHDALACLKDIKRWLRSVDEKNNSFDVALACADSGLVTNDLTVILCQWFKPTSDKIRKTKAVEKIMLSSLELLVLLTWPIDINRQTLKKDYTARTNARRAQLAYKYHILNYKSGLTLKAVISLGLNALKTPKEDREPRDVNILRLILFFIRNVLFIEPLPPSKAPKGFTNSADLPNGMSAEDINTGSVLAAFEKHKVLLFLTSIAHSVGSNLSDESFGQAVMECLSLIIKGINVDALFSVPQHHVAPHSTGQSTTEAAPASSAAGLQLQDLLKEEDKRKKIQKNSISTRHGRFGTLLSIRAPDDSGYYTVSGQEALNSTHTTLDKLDRSKKWHKMSTFKYDSNAYLSKSQVHLNLASQIILTRFVNELMVSGCFNNLLRFVGQILTSASNESTLGRAGILDAVDGHELASYFITVAWFLRYKRSRHSHYLKNNRTPTEDEDRLDYGSVGEALSEINFILLISYFRSAFDSKDHDSLHIAMICFREMLLISHTIFTKARSQREIELTSEEDVDEDRELAEGIIRKLFSQKQFLDVIVNIPKKASKHSPEYLSVVVSVVHILLKSFESLANEDVKLFIKTRRKMSKLGRKGGLNQDMDKQHWHLIDKDSEDEDDDAEIRYITQERKLDFKNTEVKFFHSDTVATHIQYLSKFEDLTREEIKRGVSFFHRLFVVRKDFSALYRLDFMNTIFRLRAFLPRQSSIRHHVEDFIVYFMKKFKTSIDRFPVALELLFPRFENSELKCYLSTGDLDTSSIKTSDSVAVGRSSYFADDVPQPKEAPLLEFIDKNKSLDEKISVIVYQMLKRNNAAKILKFVTSELDRIAALKSQGVSLVALRLTLANRRLVITDSLLRLLLENIGFECAFVLNDETILKPEVTAKELGEVKELIDKWISFHEGYSGDLEPFLDQIREMVFSTEQLNFGAQAYSNLRIGAPFDESLATSLDLDDDQVKKVIGLAKRKEFDEAYQLNRYAEDKDFDPENDINEVDSNLDYISDEDAQPQKSRKRRNKKLVSLDDSDDETTVNQKSSRRRRRSAPNLEIDSDSELGISKSAEIVHDSDDESDDEKVQTFFEREEKLRQLIQETGGVLQKESLELFKESWQKIVSADSSSQIKEAIQSASKLFVEENEDEEETNVGLQIDTPLTSTGGESVESDEEVSTSRKRRVLDDEDLGEGQLQSSKRRAMISDEEDIE